RAQCCAVALLVVLGAAPARRAEMERRGFCGCLALGLCGLRALTRRVRRLLSVLLHGPDNGQLRADRHQPRWAGCRVRAGGVAAHRHQPRAWAAYVEITPQTRLTPNAQTPGEPPMRVALLALAFFAAAFSTAFAQDEMDRAERELRDALAPA